MVGLEGGVSPSMPPAMGWGRCRMRRGDWAEEGARPSSGLSLGAAGVGSMAVRGSRALSRSAQVGLGRRSAGPQQQQELTRVKPRFAPTADQPREPQEASPGPHWQRISCPDPQPHKHWPWWVRHQGGCRPSRTATCKTGSLRARRQEEGGRAPIGCCQLSGWQAPTLGWATRSAWDPLQLQLWPAQPEPWRAFSFLLSFSSVVPPVPF